MPLSEDMGAEDFGGGPEAQALARGLVQGGAKIAEVGLREAPGVGIARDPAAKALVGMFDRSLLPRRLGIAEPGPCAGLGLQMRSVDELRSAVEGHGAARLRGQGAESSRDLRHDRLRPLLGVLQDDEEAAHTFDQRRDICGAEFLAEEDQVAFPVPKLLTVGDDLGTEQDAALRGEFRRRALAQAVAAATAAAGG